MNQSIKNTLLSSVSLSLISEVQASVNPTVEAADLAELSLFMSISGNHSTMHHARLTTNTSSGIQRREEVSKYCRYVEDMKELNAS